MSKYKYKYKIQSTRGRIPPPVYCRIQCQHFPSLIFKLCCKKRLICWTSIEAKILGQNFDQLKGKALVVKAYTFSHQWWLTTQRGSPFKLQAFQFIFFWIYFFTNIWWNWCTRNFMDLSVHSLEYWNLTQIWQLPLWHIGRAITRPPW